MSYKSRARYSDGKDPLDNDTAKMIASYMFGGFTEAEYEEGELINKQELLKNSRDLMKSTKILGKSHAQAVIYLSAMRDIYDSMTALKLCNIYMGTAISDKGLGREQGTTILKGKRFPDEIETLVSEL